MSDEPMRRGDGLPIGELPGGKPGFFSGLFQGGMVDPHARRHLHPPSPVETILYGLYFDSVSVGTENYALTPRIHGESALLQLIVVLGSDAQAAILHIVALALGRESPADAAAFNGLQQIMPFANQETANRNEMRPGAKGFGVPLVGRFPFSAHNQSIVVRFVNTSTSTVDAWIGLVLEAPH